jgi:RNA polymerase sigma factor (sigma-70 family)
MTDIDALYRKYAPDVFRFALYLAGDWSDAEDITSETFVRVWTSSTPIELATVRGYLFTIARNLFLQSQRRDARRADLPETLLSATSKISLRGNQIESFHFLIRDYPLVFGALSIAAIACWVAYAHTARRLKTRA